MELQSIVYSIEINASANKVWEALWQIDNYEKWTAFFNEGSTMKSDWKVGGQTLFLDANGDGMLSTIKSLHKPYEVVFLNLGYVAKGVSALFKDMMPEYSDAEEGYFLKEENNKTVLSTATQTMPEYMEMMQKAFVKGFEIVKQIAES